MLLMLIGENKGTHAIHDSVGEWKQIVQAFFHCFSSKSEIHWNSCKGLILRDLKFGYLLLLSWRWVINPITDTWACSSDLEFFFNG